MSDELKVGDKVVNYSSVNHIFGVFRYYRLASAPMIIVRETKTLWITKHS